MSESTSNISAALENAAHRQPGKATLLDGFHCRDHLPHLKREGGTYFVVFRQAGTLPAEIILRLKQERDQIIVQAQAAKRPLTWHEQEDLFRWYCQRVDNYLDKGAGECWLRQPAIAELVAKSLSFHQGIRFELLAWVVMPNHVHAVVRPKPGWTLSRVLKGWKGYTAREANRVLGRTGLRFWQAESFDHLIRDDRDREHCCQYTIANPVNAGLCGRAEDWPWSSAHRS